MQQVLLSSERDIEHSKVEMSSAASVLSSETSQNSAQKHQTPTPLDHESSVWHRPDVDDPEHFPPFHPLSRIRDYWASFAGKEPSASEMREAIRMELKIYWYDYREEVFGGNMRRAWTSCWGDMSTLYSGDPSRDNVGALQLRKFCNKPTALY